jgi:CheY-like chemotaxis protein
MSDPFVVVIVEDLVLVRMMIHDVLSDAGFHVIETVSGEEALRVLEARSDVMAVVTDIELGKGITGLELAHRIAQHWPSVGLILTSGRTMIAADELPARSVFLAKPYPMLALVEQTQAMAHRAAQGTLVTSEPEPEASTVVPFRAKDA